MIKLVPHVLVLALMIGCGKEEVKKAQTSAPPQEMRKSDPAAFVTQSFLSDQAAKRLDVRKQLDSLRALHVIDRDKISAVINRRKGELMVLKKNLRNSTVYSTAQRDSLIAPLEEESIELAGDLIAVAK
ncbi:hypothetical protein HUU59_00095 [bacterium]|nr:hypothetical protein [bacterium]